ncbi:MAG: 3'-5' exonuclease [Saonia sp.]
MLKWPSFRNYPDYWSTYIDHFKGKRKANLATARFVVFDTETTGLDITGDRILAIGAVAIVKNVLDVSDSIELYLKQEVFNSDTVAIHGILKGENVWKISEKEAVIKFLTYIQDAILVAHHTAFDIAMINACLYRQGLPRLKNKVLDTGILFKKTRLCTDREKHYSLDELSNLFHLKKHDRHTAAGDAYLTGIVFLKIISLLKKTKEITLKDLFFKSERRGLL